MQFSSVMPHFATQSSFFFSYSETLSLISNHLFRQRSLSLSFEVLQHPEVSLLLFILTGQGDLTKVVDIWSFPNACNIQPELRTILLHILKRCCSVSGARVTLVQQMPNIAWVSFDLQEHKIHNNVALVMEHLSLLWSNYQEYMKYQIPTNVGGKREGKKLSMLPGGYFLFRVKKGWKKSIYQ